MDLPALPLRTALVDIRVPVLPATHLSTLHSRCLTIPVIARITYEESGDGKHSGDDGALKHGTAMPWEDG